MIETIVLPTVGDEIESQYVCITLQVMFTKGYPDVKPKYQLRNSRGLDDMSIETIRKAIESKLIESLGAPVIFDLIDVIREHLTHSNLPSGQCVVCLYGFQDGDAFTKTECYHYLHSYCLARHLEASYRNHEEELEKLPAWQQKTIKPFQVNRIKRKFFLRSDMTCEKIDFEFCRHAVPYVGNQSATLILSEYVVHCNQANYKMRQTLN